MSEAWTTEERGIFGARLKAYWPLKRAPEEEEVVLNLYVTALEKDWDLFSVLRILDRLKQSRQYPNEPQVAEIHARCREALTEQELESKNVHSFIQRARQLARKGAYRLDRLGRKWFFTQDTIWCQDSGKAAPIRLQGLGGTAKHASVPYAELLNTSPNLGTLCDEARVPAEGGRPDEPHTTP